LAAEEVTGGDLMEAGGLAVFLMATGLLMVGIVGESSVELPSPQHFPSNASIRPYPVCYVPARIQSMQKTSIREIGEYKRTEGTERRNNYFF